MRGGNLHSSDYASSGSPLGASAYGSSVLGGTHQVASPGGGVEANTDAYNPNGVAGGAEQTGGRRRMRRCKSNKMGKRHAKKSGKSRRTRSRKTVSKFKWF